MSAFRCTVRIRPRLDKERDRPECVQVSANRVLVEDPFTGDGREFLGLPQVLGPDCGQDETAERMDLSSLVDAVLGGYHATVVAYGQTGSGKTHTLFGGKTHQLDGLLPRCIQTLYERKENSLLKNRVQIRASFLEISNAHGHVNEIVTDLLDSSKTNLTIRYQNDVPFVADLTCVQCDCFDDAICVLQEGAKYRRTGKTELNERSSRSHAVFTLYVENSANVVGETMLSNHFSKFQFVDLAGSERVKTSKAAGGQLQEAQTINKSLFTLAQVILAVSQTGSRAAGVHVPYRNSRLTELLSDALGGNSYCRFITCISPVFAEESIHSLSYTTRALQIENRPHKNLVLSPPRHPSAKRHRAHSNGAIRDDGVNTNSTALTTTTGPGKFGSGLGDPARLMQVQTQMLQANMFRMMSEMLTTAAQKLEEQTSVVGRAQLLPSHREAMQDGDDLMQLPLQGSAGGSVTLGVGASASSESRSDAEGGAAGEVHELRNASNCGVIGAFGLGGDHGVASSSRGPSSKQTFLGGENSGTGLRNGNDTFVVDGRAVTSENAAANGGANAEVDHQADRDGVNEEAYEAVVRRIRAEHERIRSAASSRSRGETPRGGGGRSADHETRERDQQRLGAEGGRANTRSRSSTKTTGAKPPPLPDELGSYSAYRAAAAGSEETTAGDEKTVRAMARRKRGKNVDGEAVAGRNKPLPPIGGSERGSQQASRAPSKDSQSSSRKGSYSKSGAAVGVNPSPAARGRQNLPDVREIRKPPVPRPKSDAESSSAQSGRRKRNSRSTATSAGGTNNTSDPPPLQDVGGPSTGPAKEALDVVSALSAPAEAEGRDVQGSPTRALVEASPAPTVPPSQHIAGGVGVLDNMLLASPEIVPDAAFLAAATQEQTPAGPTSSPDHRIAAPAPAAVAQRLPPKRSFFLGLHTRPSDTLSAPQRSPTEHDDNMLELLPAATSALEDDAVLLDDSALHDLPMRSTTRMQDEVERSPARLRSEPEQNAAAAASVSSSDRKTGTSSRAHGPHQAQLAPPPNRGASQLVAELLSSSPSRSQWRSGSKTATEVEMEMVESPNRISLAQRRSKASYAGGLAVGLGLGLPRASRASSSALSHVEYINGRSSILASYDVRASELHPAAQVQHAAAPPRSPPANTLAAQILRTRGILGSGGGAGGGRGRPRPAPGPGISRVGAEPGPQLLAAAAASRGTRARQIVGVAAASNSMVQFRLPEAEGNNNRTSSSTTAVDSYENNGIRGKASELDLYGGFADYKSPGNFSDYEAMEVERDREDRHAEYEIVSPLLNNNKSPKLADLETNDLRKMEEYIAGLEDRLLKISMLEQEPEA